MNMLVLNSKMNVTVVTIQKVGSIASTLGPTDVTWDVVEKEPPGKTVAVLVLWTFGLYHQTPRVILVDSASTTIPETDEFSKVQLRQTILIWLSNIAKNTAQIEEMVISSREIGLTFCTLGDGPKNTMKDFNAHFL